MAYFLFRDTKAKNREVRRQDYSVTDQYTRKLFLPFSWKFSMKSVDFEFRQYCIFNE